MKGGGSGKKKYIKKYTQPITEQGSLYGSGGVTTDSCKSILFDTRLQKVTPAIKTLSKGDELTVKNSKSELRAINSAGVVCGNIITPISPRIIECMLKGYSYKAIVKAISGSVCNVTVQTD